MAKNMIVQITGAKYADIFASIYNSANELFATAEQGAASADTFVSQIEKDINFMDMQANGDFSAFMSYHQYGHFFELTSLYVKKEYQRSGVGSQLFSHLEAQLENDDAIFVKVLKNAPWAQNFYVKHGFLPLNCQELREAAASLNIVEKSYSTVFYKTISYRVAASFPFPK